MTVSGIAGAQSPQNTSPAAVAQSAAKTGMDYDSFLKLLVAEMTNQDPLNPTTSKESIAQLATFSSVEQAIKTNQLLDSMTAVSALTQADALIGRTMTSQDGTITGTVESIRAINGGIQATLENGKTIMMGDGVSVS